MTGILNNIRETKIIDITYPKCGETFGVEFNPVIDGIFYHVNKSDGTRIRGVGTIHMKSERNLKCPHCENEFVKKREWR